MAITRLSLRPRKPVNYTSTAKKAAAVRSAKRVSAVKQKIAKRAS